MGKKDSLRISQELRTVADVVSQYMPDDVVLEMQEELEDIVAAITSRVRDAQAKEQMQSDLQSPDIA